MRATPGTSANTVLVGASIVVAIVVAVFLSYNANKGLPFVPTFELTAEVPDAQQLVAGSEVRIGGFRVGQVQEVLAVPPRGDREPFARLRLTLDPSIEGIPADTQVRIRPRSLLGGKYVELTPGDAPREIASGGRLPLENARSFPELDETFSTFGPEIRHELQATITEFGDATAGRGADINRAIAATATLMPPLQRVIETMASDRADVAGLVAAVADVTGTLAPVAPALGDAIDRAARTLAAVDAAGPSLEATLAELPATEATGTSALRAATPVLADLSDLAQALRPGTRRVPLAARHLAGALESGTRVLRRTPELTVPLNAALTELGRVAAAPAAAGSLRQLTAVVGSLLPTLRHLVPAQEVCNVGGVWSRNISSAAGEGDALGTWISLIVVFRPEQMFQRAEPESELHFNGIPHLNARECEAGNEPYEPGRHIGNPPGLQPARTDVTRPPADSRERARRAGLLDPVEGSRVEGAGQ